MGDAVDPDVSYEFELPLETPFLWLISTTERNFRVRQVDINWLFLCDSGSSTTTRSVDVINVFSLLQP